eukprot:scaffold138441_cov169-Phaeocystis_antarctica.AAC.1
MMVTSSMLVSNFMPTMNELIVAPSTYTTLALVAAKSREARRISSFIVPVVALAVRQGQVRAAGAGSRAGWEQCGLRR